MLLTLFNEKTDRGSDSTEIGLAGNFTSRWSDRYRDRAVGIGLVPWLACGARPGAQRRLAPGFVLAGQGAQRPARVQPLLA